MYSLSVCTFGQPYARAIHTLGSSTKASLSAGPCEDFTIPAVKLLSGLSTGVKHGTRLSGDRPLSMWRTTPRRSAPRLEARWRTTAKRRSGQGRRARPAGATLLRLLQSSMMADGTCAHLRGTALGRGERPSREALTKREQSTRWHQSQPRLYAVRAPVGGTPLPLDTALVTSRVRARVGAKNAPRLARTRSCGGPVLRVLADEG